MQDMIWDLLLNTRNLITSYIYDSLRKQQHKQCHTVATVNIIIIIHWSHYIVTTTHHTACIIFLPNCNNIYTYLFE